MNVTGNMATAYDLSMLGSITDVLVGMLNPDDLLPLLYQYSMAITLSGTISIDLETMTRGLLPLV